MEEDDLQQKNKRHAGVRDKLKRKRKQLKEIKKEKSQKKKDYDRDEHKKIYFGQKESKKEKKEKYKDKYGINQKKLMKWLKKFQKAFKEDMDDFLAIFDQMEEGEEVDISDMANANIKECLQKLFKTLKISESKLVFRKKSKCKVENLKEYMCKKLQELEAEKSDSSDDSDDEGNSENSEMEQEKPVEETKQQQPTSSIGPSVGPSIGPSTGPQGPVNHDGDAVNKDELQKFEEQMDQIAQKKENPQRDDWMKGDFDNFMNDAFSGLEQKKLKNFLDNRQKPGAKASFSGDQNVNFVQGSGKLDEQPKQDEEQTKQFMEEYNQRYRQKSLLQQHQEKQRIQKMELKASGDNFRAPFNPDKDLGFSKVDGKRLFAQLKDTDVLRSKFTSKGGTTNFL